MTLDYIARCPTCKKVNQAIACEMERVYLSKRIAEIIREGGEVERLETDEIRKTENWCNCHRAQKGLFPE